MTDWNAWSRIIDAAQDPQHRQAVQKFLAQAELSADIPAVLDEKFLAPRRPAEATAEQCAYLLCNLGFAALARGSRESAAFGIACGRVAEQLAPDMPDLELRRLFLSAKGTLVNALQTDWPHIYWDDVAERCTAYIGSIDQHLESLPAEAIDGNAMAAFSFAGKALSKIRGFRATAHYARDVASLVSAALRLEQRLPPALVARIGSTIMPGTDAWAFFRETGAEAERALQAGEAAAAPELPAQSPPSSDQAVEAWCTNWLADASEGHWTRQSDDLPGLDDIRETWGLEALAATDSGDAMKLISALDRFGGFLADSFLRDRQQWAARLKPANDRPPLSPEEATAQSAASAGEPSAALDEIFAALGEGTALLQVARTGAGILTTATRRRDGEIVTSPAPQKRSADRLRDAHKAWSRAHFDTFRQHAGRSDSKTDCAAAFAELLDAVDDTWGDLLQGLLEDDVTQFVLIGDDCIDIPLHAARTGNGDERLIDRLPVSWVPSLTALQASSGRSPADASQRQGIRLGCLADTDLHAEAINALATTLGADPLELSLPGSASFNENAAACQVLHVAARLEHNARLPFDSVVSAGAHRFSLAEFVAGLALPGCDVVSSFACEAVLPSMLRAPGLDLATLLLAAGARNVLASSWATDDELAAAMTHSFFDYRADGQAPAPAFRQALADLRSGRAPPPDYLWAGMRLAGAP